jgi:preprotein translocase subunit SecB
MLEVKEAAFSFESFKVSKFSYDESNDSGSEIKLGFLPSGVYNQNLMEYELTLKFISYSSEDENKIIFDLTSVSIFKFNTQLDKDDIPPYFYRNSIAIIFPYIRSFISTLTLQANTKLLKLGLMNLSELERPLIDNTVSI